jgi:hypothetical protein
VRHRERWLPTPLRPLLLLLLLLQGVLTPLLLLGCTAVQLLHRLWLLLLRQGPVLLLLLQRGPAILQSCRWHLLLPGTPILLLT